MTVEEVKSKYPPGTLFFPAHLHNSDIQNQYRSCHLVNSNTTFFQTATGDIYADNSDTLDTMSSVLWYNSGGSKRCAEIITGGYKSKFLIEIAQKVIKIGNRYTNTNIISFCKAIISITGNDFYINNAGGVSVRSDSANKQGNFTVYSIDGIWAKEYKEEKSIKATPVNTDNWIIEITNSNINAVKDWWYEIKKFGKREFNIGSYYGIIDNEPYSRRDLPTQPYDLISFIDFRHKVESDRISSKVNNTKISTLSNRWLLRITSDNIDLVNEYRRSVGRHPISANERRYIIWDGSYDGGAILDKPDTRLITDEEFISIMREKGIIHIPKSERKANSTEDWIFRFTKVDIDIVNCYRRYRGASDLSIGINSGIICKSGVFLTSGATTDLPEIDISQFIDILLAKNIPIPPLSPHIQSQAIPSIIDTVKRKIPQVEMVPVKKRPII